MHRKKQEVTNYKPEWHFLWEGCFSEMPEECNNIIYNYIILFKCITLFYEQYMNNIMHISGEKEQYGVSHRNKKKPPYGGLFIS